MRDVVAEEGLEQEMGLVRERSARVEPDNLPTDRPLRRKPRKSLSDGSGIGKGLNAPEVLARIEALGLVPIGDTPEQFATLVRTSFDLYGKAVKAAKLEPQ